MVTVMKLNFSVANHILVNSGNTSRCYYKRMISGILIDVVT